VLKPLLHLSLIKGVGPLAVKKILQNLDKKKLSLIYDFSIEYFMEKCGLTRACSKKIYEGLSDFALLEKELGLIEKSGARWATVIDDEYPEALKNITFPPTVIYWFGASPKLLEKSMAFVGSRKANSYGAYAIDRIIPPLVSLGWSIISGGAIGADRMAHAKTIDCGGITCAVLGSGLLKSYPACNKKLFLSILETGGTVMSSFPLNTPAMPGNFPARNRIIAGIAKTTVIVQAAKKSGARITAMYALEEGRTVCAIPGSINDPLSQGCHLLIHEGATLVSSSEDILQATGYFVESQKINNNISEPKLELDIKKSRIKFFEETLLAGKKNVTKIDPIIELCRKPLSFDEILELEKFNFNDLQEHLLKLQLDGQLEQDLSGRYLST